MCMALFEVHPQGRCPLTSIHQGSAHWHQYSPGAALRNRLIKKSGPPNKLSRLKKKGRRRPPPPPPPSPPSPLPPPPPPPLPRACRVGVQVWMAGHLVRHGCAFRGSRSLCAALQHLDLLHALHLEEQQLLAAACGRVGLGRLSLALPVRESLPPASIPPQQVPPRQVPPQQVPPQQVPPQRELEQQPEPEPKRLRSRPLQRGPRHRMLGSESLGSATICMISQAVEMAWAAGISGGRPSSAFSAFAFATSDSIYIYIHFSNCVLQTSRIFRTFATCRSQRLRKKAAIARTAKKSGPLRIPVFLMPRQDCIMYPRSPISVCS